MDNKIPADTATPSLLDERRAFLAKAGKLGIVAPAAALLLAATTRKAAAVEVGYGRPVPV